MGAMRGHVLAVAALAVALGFASSASAQTAEQFYAGRKMEMIISSGAGGGYDVSARLTARHMERFIPGHPTIVARNMPGAGHALAAQHLYNVAAQDGSVIATLGQNLPMAQLLQPEKIKFRMEKFNWIGNVSQDNNVTVAWHTAGVTSFADLESKELIVGAQGINSTSAQYPLALRNLLGAKFRIISGFSGTQTIILAMERGEVAGLGSNSWATWKAQHPDWVKERKIIPLVQMGLHRAPDLPDVPLLTELARNAAQRQVFDMLSSGIVVGRPILTTPNVPADRVAILRAAFNATMTDESYLADSKKAKLDVDPLSGAELQKYVEELVTASPDALSLLKAALLDQGTFDCAKLVKDISMCESPATSAKAD
jgi:tripartite-type tricarboxylate transporter receptor subunit TctC